MAAALRLPPHGLPLSALHLSSAAQRYPKAVNAGHRCWNILLAACIVGFGSTVAGCAWWGNSTPTVSRSQLTGTWSGTAGSMTFSADGAFVARDLRIGVKEPRSCEPLPTSGTWRYATTRSGIKTLNHPGSAKSGSQISITYAGSQHVCHFDLVTWEVDSPLTLCYFDGLNTTCPGPRFTKLSESQTRT